jgi:hypothetical protein
MKTKKRTYVFLLASLLVSACLLCFGISGIKTAHAEESVVTESTVSTEDTVATEEPSAADTAAENYNAKIKAWIDTILGSAGVAFDTLLLVALSKKNKQSVAVTVNDSTTQEKLDTMQANYDCLKKLLIDMFQLTKGTFDVLLTLYSDNKSLDDNIRSAIKSISLNSADIIKDFSDIVGADKHKAAKTALQNISNIVLG